MGPRPHAEWVLADPLTPRDVRLFGAYGDGMHDDTAAMQAAVDATPEGGTVLVPEGRYRISASDGVRSTGIALHSSLVLELAQGARLEAIPTVAEEYAIVRIRDAAHVVVRGGTLVGERDAHLGVGGEHGFGVEIRGSSDVLLDGVWAQDFWGDGFYVGTSYPVGVGNAGVHVRGCTATNNRRQGLSIVNCSGALIEGSRFATTHGTFPEGGIDLEPNPMPATLVVENVEIRGCVFDGNAGFGVLTAGGAAPSGPNYHSSIHDNLMAGNGVGLRFDKSSSVVAQGNVIADSATYGIILTGSSSVTVRGNQVVGSGQAGIRLERAADSIVAGNFVSTSSGAMDLGYDNLALTDHASRNLLDGNVCRAGAGPARPRYGIYIATPDCDGNVVAGNDLVEGGAVAPYQDRGTGTIRSF
jgi:parallel beta-helix repeat protein